MKQILGFLNGDHKLLGIIKQVAEREPMGILSHIGDTGQPYTMAFAKSLSMTVAFAVKGITRSRTYQKVGRSSTHKQISKLTSFIAWKLILLAMRSSAASPDGEKYGELMVRFGEISNLMYPRCAEVNDLATRLVAAENPPGGIEPDSIRVAQAYVGAIDACLGLEESKDVARLAGEFGYLAMAQGTWGRLFNELMQINNPRA